MASPAAVVAQNKTETQDKDLEWVNDTALALAPKNAAFFSSLSRGDQIIKNVWQSSTVEKLRQIPCIKEFEIKRIEQWESGDDEVGQVKSALKNPNINALVQLAADMFSNEIFVYGDGKYVTTYREAVKLQAWAAELQQTFGDEDLMRQKIREAIESLEKEDADKIRIPTTVVGFKLKDNQRALDLLDQLHGLISLGLGQLDQLKSLSKGFQRRDTSSGTTLSLTLKADTIPWDSIPNPDSEEDAEIANLAREKFRQLLQGRQFTITLGVYEKYLIIATGEDADVTRQFKSPDHLYDHNQMRSLVRRAPEELISVGYVSDAFAKASWELTFKNFLRRNGDALAVAAKKSAEEENEVVPAWVEQVRKDLTWLDDEMLAIVPEFKGGLSFAWLTKNGIAGEAHPRTEAVFLDGKEPLEVLKHVGANPLGFITCRPADHPEWFELMVEIGERAKWYLDYLPESGLIDDDDVEEYDAALAIFLPLIEDCIEVTRDQFIPGFKNTEVGWVMDAKMASKQWWKDMPESLEPLPMFEFAKVAKVADQARVRTGLASGFDIANELVAGIRKMEPSAIPESYSIPTPEMDTLGNAERYSYAIPDDCPVPATLLPQLVLGQDWIVAGYSTTQAESLMGEKAFDDPIGVIRPDKPLALACYINFAEINAVIRPWIEYGLIQEGKLDQDLLGNDDLPPFTGTELLEVWDLMRVCGVMSSATTQQPSGQLVVRWKWVLKD